MSINLKTVVVYYRVSTKRQGESGLGLKGQQAAVSRLLGLHPGSRVVAVFTEIETGRNEKRHQLNRAIQLCKETGAVLVVAKLDRLARNVAFTSTLMNSGVEFVACDMPEASRLTIHIMAAIAEDEADRIAERTRAGLAQTDKPLGSARPGHWDGREHVRGWSGVPEEEKALLKTERLAESFGHVLPMIQELRSRGESYQKIADALNHHGFKTPKGRKFTRSSVYQVLQRHETLTPQARAALV